MEEGISKRNFTKMIIKVSEIIHNEKDFIMEVWNLMKKVCLRTGMTIEPIYKKEDDADTRKNKEKHYLVSCLEEVRRKIKEKNIQVQLNNLRDKDIPDFDIVEWLKYQVNNNKRKLNAKNRKHRHNDAKKAVTKAKEIEVVELCSAIDQLIEHMLLLNAVDDQFQAEMNKVLDKTSKPEELGFEWRPHLGAYKPPEITVLHEGFFDNQAAVLHPKTTLNSNPPGSSPESAKEANDSVVNPGDNVLSKESETIASEIIETVIYNVLSNVCKDDSPEENFGLLSALKEMSGMEPPPPAMDWSISNVCSFL